MASSRKPPSAKRIAVALSGGVDSVVLLHLLRAQPGVSAIHVHHGLSPNADAWARFCRSLCRNLGIPLAVRKVKVRKTGKGLEAAAREARYEVFKKDKARCIALAHNLDDQAETVLMNLLRGAGVRGAGGMRRQTPFHQKILVRPLLDIPRAAIEAYARAHRLEWIEDETNADESLTRNFVRRRLGPLVETRFPRWKQSLARAARHFSEKELHSNRLLRQFLSSHGLKAPSEAKLVEMLKQLTAGGARTRIEHDGALLRVYRGRVLVQPDLPLKGFSPVKWRGEPRLPIPALGGEIRFRSVRGKGIDPKYKPLQVRVRSGGERLQPDARRPRRTLKNLFQEAGVPSWARERMPMLFHGDDLVWVPGLGIDARFQARASVRGLLPEWRSASGDR